MSTITTERPRTYEEARTPAQKAEDAEVLEAVQRGIAFLEREYGPDWVDHIDLEILDIASINRCVLGQLYKTEVTGSKSGFGYGLDKHNLWEDARDYGFTGMVGVPWRTLNNTWKRAIAPLIQKRK